MQPFNVSEPAKKFVDHYPVPELLKSLGPAISSYERECFIRLWLSEGIPQAFGKLPMIYEVMRGWIAKQLSISPKNITLVGSARLGYSLKPKDNFGRQFEPASDLDLAIISDYLFSLLSDDFNNWKQDYESKVIAHRNENEKSCWEDNLKKVPNNITRGFIDIHKIPFFVRYKAAQKLGQIRYLLGQKLLITTEAPGVKKISIRVYRDWEAFVGQTSLNLSLALGLLNKN